MNYAYIVPTRRHFPRFYEERIHGVSVLRCELPSTSVAMRKRCALMLWRCGVRWMLNDGLGGQFPLVPTKGLWQSRGADLVLMWMDREGIPPEETVVGLLAKRVTGSVCRAAEQLSDHVKAIALMMPDDNGLSSHLQQRNGVPILRGYGGVNLCFDEWKLETSKNMLNIGRIQPSIEGIALHAAVTVPDGCPAEALYAALVHEGMLSEGEIHLRFVNK